MKQLHRLLLAVLVAAPLTLLAPAEPALAQEDVMRDVYGFFGSSLDVDVAAEAPGRIRFIRGRRSRIEVAGRAPNGFTSAALGGHGVRRLTLTALGSDQVDFVVVVPEDVRVRVRWEGSNRSELFGTLDETATYAWQANLDRPAFETFRPGSRESGGAEAPARRAAIPTPRILDIEGAHRLERLTVRIEGSDFALSPAHLLDTGRSDHVSVRAPEHGDVSVFIPRGHSLTLRLDGVEAIVIDDQDVRVLCEAVLSQTLPDGRRWLTLTPEAAGGCSLPAPPARHLTPAAHRRG